ncbi:MAG TPA: LapA family protein [Actinospica sp.]|nr:LapA family protein [Actinospica sp.]
MTENADRRDPSSISTPVPARMKRTRLGGLWVVGVLGAVVLVLLLVFILMNGQRVQIHLYGAHVTIPLGVGLLFAAALGVLLVVIPGAGRIIQLKRAGRRLHKEREHLAGRLDEVTGATSASTSAAAAQQQADQQGQYAGSQTAGERPEQAPGQAPEYVPGDQSAGTGQPQQPYGEQPYGQEPYGQQPPPSQQPPTRR